METTPAKTILGRNKDQNWFGTSYTMNLYRGCCHGCLYCDSRSDCYHLERFGTVRAKQNALPILRDELARRVKKGVVATGAMSDPYNPFEKKEQLTRNALQLLDAFGYGAAIATKSDLVARDADILAEIHTHSPVLCKFTITCGDALAAKLEPHAPPPTRRLQAMAALARRDIFCGVLLMPVMPQLTDTDENILWVVQAAAAAGARFIYPYFGVTMRSGQRQFLLDGLQRAFPGDEGLLRRYHAYGERYHCGSPRARHLWSIFTAACQKHGLLYNMPDIIRAYRSGRETGQLSLLGNFYRN